MLLPHRKYSPFAGVMDTTRSVIHILLVYSQHLIRAGLRSLLEAEQDFLVTAEAVNWEEALIAVRSQPDIILLDLKLDEEHSLEALRQISAVTEHSRVIVLTDSLEAEQQHLAVRHGAMGVIGKTEAPAILYHAIRKVQAGEVWLNRTIVATVLRDLVHLKETFEDEIPKHQRLTEREREVIALVGEGLRNKEIAERLYISEATIRHYLTSIFEKVGVINRQGLIIYAYQHNLAKLPLAQDAVKKVRG